MSLQNILSSNDLHIFCDTMTCNNLGANCINNCSNLGSGSQVFKQISGLLGSRIAEFRTLTSGSNITLTQNANDIQISSSDTNTNIYNSDGTLTGQRAVGLGGNILLFGQAPTPTTPAMFRIQNGQIDIQSDAGNTYIGSGIQTSVNVQAINVNLLGTIATPSYSNGLISVNNIGQWSVIPNKLISVYTQTVPGAYNVAVPANSRYAIISAVGGGGAGDANAFGDARGGGGAGGAIIEFPVSVKPGNNIVITIGQGGLNATDNGTDTTVTCGTLVITCSGGVGATTNAGAAGGGVTLSTFGTVSGPAGGAYQTNGVACNMEYHLYSGGSGGGANNDTDQPGGDGGNCAMFAGGAHIQSAIGVGGGGGASAFADGGRAGVNFAFNAGNGSLGSGGGGSVISGTTGTGGNGYCQITFTS